MDIIKNFLIWIRINLKNYIRLSKYATPRYRHFVPTLFQQWRKINFNDLEKILWTRARLGIKSELWMKDFLILKILNRKINFLSLKSSLSVSANFPTTLFVLSVFNLKRQKHKGKREREKNNGRKIQFKEH